MRKLFASVTRSKAIHKLLSTLALLSLAFSSLGSSPAERAQAQQVTYIPAEFSSALEEGTLYYYSDNRRIPLTVATNTLMVRMAPGISVQGIAEYLIESYVQLSADGVGIQALDHGLDLLLFSEPSTAEAILQSVAKLSKMASVELVGPAFDAQGAIMLVTDEIIVQFGEDVIQNEIAALNRAMGTQVVGQSPYVKNNYVLHVPLTNALDVLAAANRYYEHPLVAYAHPNFTRVISPLKPLPDNGCSTLPNFHLGWEREKTRLFDAFDITTGDNNIIISIVDDGIDIDHQHLKNKFIDPYDAYDSNLYGTHDYDPSPPLIDDAFSGQNRQVESHGTSVCGVVANVCPDCRIIPVRISRAYWSYNETKDEWEYQWNTADWVIADGINWASQNNANVLNFSWHGGDPSDAIDSAIHNAISNECGQNLW